MNEINYKKFVQEWYDKSSEYWKKSEDLYGRDPICQLYDRRENKVMFEEFLVNTNLDGVKVLDVACGAGRWVVQYSKKGADLTAVDLSLSMLNCARTNAKKRGLSASFVRCDAENLPFRPKSFDLINCIDALVARPKGPERSIQEIARVLKSEKVAIIEPSNYLSLFGPLWWTVNLCRRIGKKLGLETYPPGVWLFPWQMKKMVKEHGLKLTSVRSVGIVLPPSKILLKIAISFDENLSKNSFFKWMGSRVLLLCHKLS